MAEAKENGEIQAARVFIENLTRKNRTSAEKPNDDVKGTPHFGENFSRLRLAFRMPRSLLTEGGRQRLGEGIKERAAQRGSDLGK